MFACHHFHVATKSNLRNIQKIILQIPFSFLVIFEGMGLLWDLKFAGWNSKVVTKNPKANIWGTKTRQAWEVWLWKNSTCCYWSQKFMSIHNTSAILHGGILIHICWSKSGTTHEHSVRMQTWIPNIGLAKNVQMSTPRKHTARDGNIYSLFLYHLNINIQLLHTMQLQPFYCRQTLGKSSDHCCSSQQCMIKPIL